MQSAAPIFVLGSFVAAVSMKVARLPAPGETLQGDALLLEAGGKGLNVAIAARRLGAYVDGVVAIGTDRLASMAVEALAAAQLPAHILIQFPGPSGTGVGLIDTHGENIIAVYAGANALLSAQNIEAAASRIAGSSAVVAQFEITDEPIAAAFAVARHHGVRTILNPSPFRPIARQILAATDVLAVNASEANAMAASLALNAADHSTDSWQAFRPLATALFQTGLEVLIVTLGSGGAALWHRDGTSFWQPAFPARAVDATGCGDAFLAGLIVCASLSNDWAEALRLGCACGTITCARVGVVGALPTYADASELARHQLSDRDRP